MQFLALCGSLRAGSLNAAALEAAAMVAPGYVDIARYDGIATLPAYNPDLCDHLPPSVQSLRTRVATADALLVATPQYAHGVPGALKNAIDWLADGDVLPGKPVAVIATSPCDSWAHSLLADTLRVLAARVVIDASVILVPRRNARHRDLHASADLLRVLNDCVASLAREVREQRRRVPHDVDPATGESFTSDPPGPPAFAWSDAPGHRAFPGTPRSATSNAE